MPTPAHPRSARLGRPPAGAWAGFPQRPFPCRLCSSCRSKLCHSHAPVSGLVREAWFILQHAEQGTTGCKALMDPSPSSQRPSSEPRHVQGKQGEGKHACPCRAIKETRDAIGGRGRAPAQLQSPAASPFLYPSRHGTPLPRLQFLPSAAARVRCEVPKAAKGKDWQQIRRGGHYHKYLEVVAWDQEDRHKQISQEEGQAVNEQAAEAMGGGSHRHSTGCRRKMEPSQSPGALPLAVGSSEGNERQECPQGLESLVGPSVRLHSPRQTPFIMSSPRGRRFENTTLRLGLAELWLGASPLRRDCSTPGEWEAGTIGGSRRRLQVTCIVDTRHRSTQASTRPFGG